MAHSPEERERFEKEAKRAGLRVVIGMPTPDYMAAGTANDLAMMMGSIGADMIAGGAEIRLLTSIGEHLMPQRQELAEYAVHLDSTHFLLLHPRQRFPKELLHRLLLRRLPVVGINSVIAGTPPLPEAMHRDGPAFSADRTGVEAVTILPLAALLIETHVLRTLPKPWFQHMHVDGEYGHEAAGFSSLCIQHGHQVHVDHDLSVLCSNPGLFEYRHEHTRITREEVQKPVIVAP